MKKASLTTFFPIMSCTIDRAEIALLIVGESVPTGGGFVAILGALVVGLEVDGFRDGAFDNSFVGLSGGNCVGAAVGGRVLACMGETDG